MPYQSLSRLLLGFIVVGAAGLAGCTTAEDTGLEPVACPTDNTLTYANFGEQFVADHCLECHDGDESPRLTTQASIQQRTSQLLHEAVYTTAMPEDEDLSLDTRKQFGEWLACGAP